MLKHDILVATPRFMSRVRAVDGCWLWMGDEALDVAGRSIKPERFAWIRFNGRLPTSRRLLRSCGDERCVNPKHLEVRDNQWTGSEGRQRGERHHKAKLTVDEIDEIRNTKITATLLSKRLGVAVSTIRKIRRRERWSHI